LCSCIQFAHQLLICQAAQLSATIIMSSKRLTNKSAAKNYAATLADLQKKLAVALDVPGDSFIPEGQLWSSLEALRTSADRAGKEFGSDSDEYKAKWATYENVKQAWDAFVKARNELNGTLFKAGAFRFKVLCVFGKLVSPGTEQDALHECGQECDSHKYAQILPFWLAFDEVRIK